MSRRVCLVLIAWGLPLLLSGCFNRSVPEVAYYNLQSMEQLELDITSGPPIPELVLGVGPVTIPASLKRSQIVTREADNRYRFSDLHRWAGLLEEDLGRALGENLALLLGLEHVVYYPWSQIYRPDRRVLIEVLRLDGTREGEAVLSVRWTLIDSEGSDPLADGKSVYRRTVETGGYAGLVRTESLLLVELSREIARAVRETAD